MTQKLSMVLALAAATMFISACAEESDSNNSSTPSCTNDAVQCSAAGVPQKCVDGAWVDQTACATGQTCSNGTCSASGTPQQPGAACQNNQKKCDEKGVPMLCTAGQWKAQNACAAGTACKDGECVNGGGSGTDTKCTNNEKKCDEKGVPMLCINNAWTAQNACESGKTCNNGECVGGGGQEDTKCTNDDKKCDEKGVPMLCVNNVWTAQAACENGKTCNDGDCVGGGEADKCKNDEKKCDEKGIPMLCVNNAWTAQTACESGKTCNDGDCVGGGEADKCKNDEKKCDEKGVPMLCVNNTWTAQKACESGKTCKDGDCIGGSSSKCANGTTELNGICVNNEMNAAKANTECKKEWYDLEFCDASNNAVYCGLEDKYWDDLDKYFSNQLSTLPDPDNYKVVVTKDKCKNSCVNADLSSYYKKSYYSAICKDDYNTKCKKANDIFGICEEYEDEDYAETYVYACYPTVDGGFIGIDVEYYYEDEDIEKLSILPGECNSGMCNNTSSACEPVCSSDNDCKDSEYPYCSKDLDDCVECKDNSQCASSEKGKLCSIYFGECTECNEDKDCASGKKCNILQGKCE